MLPWFADSHAAKLHFPEPFFPQVSQATFLACSLKAEKDPKEVRTGLATTFRVPERPDFALSFFFRVNKHDLRLEFPHQPPAPRPTPFFRGSIVSPQIIVCRDSSYVAHSLRVPFPGLTAFS